jgi:hypothetical protein
LFLHVIKGDVVEVSTFRELAGTPRFLLSEFSDFLNLSRAGDVFVFQRNEHFIALGAVTRASWLG